MQNDLISRSALLEEIEGIYKRHYEKSCYQFIHDFFKAIFRRINKAPAVDAVEVVRCRDCKRCYKHITKRHKQTMWLCMRHDLEVCVRPDDFCSYGERKADDGK